MSEPSQVFQWVSWPVTKGGTPVHCVFGGESCERSELNVEHKGRARVFEVLLLVRLRLYAGMNPRRDAWLLDVRLLRRHVLTRGGCGGVARDPPALLQRSFGERLVKV